MNRCEEIDPVRLVSCKRKWRDGLRVLLGHSFDSELEIESWTFYLLL